MRLERCNRAQGATWSSADTPALLPPHTAGTLSIPTGGWASLGKKLTHFQASAPIPRAPTAPPSVPRSCHSSRFPLTVPRVPGPVFKAFCGRRRRLHSPTAQLLQPHGAGAPPLFPAAFGRRAGASVAGTGRPRPLRSLGESTPAKSAAPPLPRNAQIGAACAAGLLLLGGLGPGVSPPVLSAAWELPLGPTSLPIPR